MSMGKKPLHPPLLMSRISFLGQTVLIQTPALGSSEAKRRIAIQFDGSFKSLVVDASVAGAACVCTAHACVPSGPQTGAHKEESILADIAATSLTVFSNRKVRTGA